MLAFSNFGHPPGERTLRVQEAVRILDSQRVDFEYDGEMGADVALNRELMAAYPFCRLTDTANVLIMPAFHSAAISTRMLQELGGATVIGPLIVGLRSRCRSSRSARRTPTSSTWRRWRASTSAAELALGQLRADLLHFSLATWNINSVRLRIDLVARFLNEHRPDVLCLQETKCPDGQFPGGEFRELGYKHIALNGQKGYHGVAIVSRHPFAEESRRDFCAKGDSRHVAVTLSGKAAGIEIHNFYVPAGGDEPDPDINDKFAHKLAFVDEITAFSQAEPRTSGAGDFGWRSGYRSARTRCLRAIRRCCRASHTPIEVENSSAPTRPARGSMRWQVRYRRLRNLTWWSYRSPDWAAGDKVRRLDHVWVSPMLEDAVKSMHVAKDARGWERPSDHAPAARSNSRFSGPPGLRSARRLRTSSQN